MLAIGKADMHGCFDANIVYGFSECAEDAMLDYDWLRSTGVSIFASEVIRCHMCTPIYGNSCVLDQSGRITIEAPQRSAVDALHLRYSEYRASQGLSLPEAASFHLAVSGDIESQQSVYTLDDDDDC